MNRPSPHGPDTAGPRPSPTGVASFRFFGIPFAVSSDDPGFLDTYRFTYRRMGDAAAEGEPGGLLFHVASPRGAAGAPAVTFTGGSAPDLAETYRRGSNRYRFTLEPEADGWTGVRDGFLGGAHVMSVKGACSVIRDADRWRAYCESVIFHTVVAQRADRFLLHAGVMASGDRGVILCGEANRGKTTLVLNLARRGLTFLSDEIAWIDLDTHRVRAFPRTLGLREATLAMLGAAAQGAERRATRSLSGDDKWLVDLPALASCPVGEECRAHAVVFLDGFGPATVLTPLAPSAGALGLLRYAHTGDAGAVATLMAAAEALGGATFHSLTAGPPEEAAAAVMHLVDP